jgi:predicted XRE-type DNA-binding protein
MSGKKSRQLGSKVIPRDQLSREVRRAIAERDLSGAAAARLMNDAPSKISGLLHGRIDGFSAERLVRMLTLLGTNVDIVLRRDPYGRRGVVRVRRSPVE